MRWATPAVHSATHTMNLGCACQRKASIRVTSRCGVPGEPGTSETQVTQALLMNTKSRCSKDSDPHECAVRQMQSSFLQLAFFPCGARCSRTQSALGPGALKTCRILRAAARETTISAPKCKARRAELKACCDAALGPLSKHATLATHSPKMQ